MEQSSLLPLKYIMPEYILGKKKPVSHLQRGPESSWVYTTHPDGWNDLPRLNRVLCPVSWGGGEGL